MENSVKCILVTGGAGFLGSHLCEKLLKSGNKIICVDNLITGSLQNVAYLTQYQHFEFCQHDISLPFEYLTRVHQIYNLACPASPEQYQRHPIETFKSCVFGAANMLSFCQQNAARILQASTSEVYGDPAVHPQSEAYFGNVNTQGVRACYEEGKRAAETLFFDYHRQHHLDIKIARLFNVYGPRMQLNDGRVIPNFILQALQNQPLTIYGDGLQTRSFCYVTDTINGLVQLMQAGSDFIGPVNIGSTAEMSMLELAELIISLTGSRSPLHFKPKPQDDPQKRRPDIQLAAKKLGWAPSTPFVTGLKLTIAYFETMLNLASSPALTQKVAGCR